MSSDPAAPRLTAEELALARRLRDSLAGFLDTPTPTSVVLPDGRIILVNRAHEVLQGMTRDELLGRGPRGLFVGSEHIDIPAQLATLLDPEAGPRVSSIELLRPNGEHVPVRAVSIALRDADGQAFAVLTRFMRVERERRWIETASAAGIGLEEDATHLLTQALLATPDFLSSERPMLILHPDMRVLRVNGAFTHAFGWPNEELVGLDAREVVAGAPARAQQRLADLMRTGTGLAPVHAAELRHRDGSRVPVDGSSMVVRDEAGAARWVLSVAMPRGA